MAPSFCYKSFNSSAISCNSLLNICEYIFNVVAISLWPKYFETKATLAPLFINKLAQLCLKSCILILFTPADLQFLFFLV